MQSRVGRAGVVAVATIVPAIVVWFIIGAANPPKHDLSDIVTGLIQLGLSTIVAVIGFAVSMIATRRNS